MMPMTKSPPITKLREAGDDVAGRRRPFGAVRKDEPRRRNVERQPQHRRDQEHGREGREFERRLDPQRDHQDEHRKRDRERQAEVDEKRRQRQEQDHQDPDHADGKASIPLNEKHLDGAVSGLRCSHKKHSPRAIFRGASYPKLARGIRPAPAETLCTPPRPIGLGVKGDANQRRYRQLSPWPVSRLKPRHQFLSRERGLSAFLEASLPRPIP